MGATSTTHLGFPSLSFTGASFSTTAGAMTPVASMKTMRRVLSIWSPAAKTEKKISPPMSTGKTAVPIQNDFFVTRSRYSRRMIISMLCIADPFQDRRLSAADLLDEDVVERRGDELEFRDAEAPRDRPQDRLRVGARVEADLGVRAERIDVRDAGEGR